MHIPGAMATSGLFLLDLWLTREAGVEVLAELQALAGRARYNRIDIRFARGVTTLKAGRCPAGHGAEAMAGRPVARRQPLETGDGLSSYRDDGSWLLIRFSGTEARCGSTSGAHTGGRGGGAAGAGRAGRCRGGR
jgi:hypothetical protein